MGHFRGASGGSGARDSRAPLGSISARLRHRRILLGFLALVSVLAATTWFVLARTGLVRGLVAGVLARTVRGELSVGDVRFDLLDGRLTLAGRAGSGRRLKRSTPTTVENNTLFARH